MSLDPYGKFGPMGKYGAYGTVGSIVNLVGGIVIVGIGTVVIFTSAIPAGMPAWFAAVWIAVGCGLIWRFALLARSVRRREQEQAAKGAHDDTLPSSKQ